MSIVLFVKKYFYSKLKLCFYIIISVITGILPLISNYLLGNIVDNINTLNDKSKIYRLCFIYLLSILLLIIINSIKEILYTKLQISTSFNMNKDILEHVKRLPLKFFENIDLVYLNQRINNDSNNIVIFFINIVSDIITNIFIVIFMLVVLVSININIFYVFFITLILYVLLYILAKKKIYIYNFKMQESQSEYFSKLNEQISNIKFIKTHIIFDILKRRLESSYKLLMNSILKRTKFKILFTSVESIITAISQVIFIAIIAVSVIRGNITIGLFSVLINYFFTLVNSLKYFIGIAENYQENLGCYNRIFNLLNQSKEQNGNVVISDCLTIKLKNILFSYNENNILNNFNYTFNKSNIYCIVGENGSGKSTLINILTGLYIENYFGNVFYNDIPIEDLNMYKLRKSLIGLSEQEPLLINDTVFNNLIINNENFNNDLLSHLMDYFDIKDIIDKIVDENNTNISGGEKQKISIIRLLLKDSKVLIFDEPTSALDTNSIIMFKEILKKIKNNKIIIIITHDKNLLDLADYTLNLENIMKSANNIGQAVL